MSRADAGGIKTDVLIIGGGFGGMYGLYRMRQLGVSVKLFEAGADFGGTWFWNRYPGARVDSEVPFYSLSIPEVYKDWHFTERYPGHEELRRYFKHVDDVLGLRKDSYFNTVVVEASFNPQEARWHVKTRDGLEASATYILCATGSSYKKHYPSFDGLDTFTGQLIHSAEYPEAGIDMTGKKVGVIGSGATGLQIVQELGREGCDITAFVRTPNVAIPMRQRKLTKEEQSATKHLYQALYNAAKQCSSGFPYTPATKGYHECTPEERRQMFEMLYERGGFSFMLSTFPEYITDRGVNAEIYQFWVEKTRQRLQNPFKRNVLAPLEQPHWLGTKRASLEHDYYEVVDRDNVSVVDLKRTPLVRIEEKGVRTSEQLLNFDILILATGYDALTGSLLDMGLKGTDGVPLTQKWEKATFTYMGLTIPRFPNLFLSYSPQAPTSLANGPPIIEMQIDWAAAAIRKMREQGIKYIDAKQSFAEDWRNEVNAISDSTLFKGTKSWYNGGNIEGKPIEQLVYLGGLVNYERKVFGVLGEGSDQWAGFDIVRNDSTKEQTAESVKSHGAVHTEYLPVGAA
ncbi:steroid monooxygenase [Pyrenochaeta sp. DS3sAY3a]|nr:steroid monooxygenase [Pyrenochaeta sp. DS3sAY3a]